MYFKAKQCDMVKNLPLVLLLTPVSRFYAALKEVKNPETGEVYYLRRIESLLMGKVK